MRNKHYLRDISLIDQIIFFNILYNILSKCELNRPTAKINFEIRKLVRIFIYQC